MAYRIAVAGAVGPFVGPWIRSVGTEYAIEVNGAAVLETQSSESKLEIFDLDAQQHQFPPNVVRYRFRITSTNSCPITARVHLR